MELSIKKQGNKFKTLIIVLLIILNIWALYLPWTYFVDDDPVSNPYVETYFKRGWPNHDIERSTERNAVLPFSALLFFALAYYGVQTKNKKMALALIPAVWLARKTSEFGHVFYVRWHNESVFLLRWSYEKAYEVTGGEDPTWAVGMGDGFWLYQITIVLMAIYIICLFLRPSKLPKNDDSNSLPCEIFKSISERFRSQIVKNKKARGGRRARLCFASMWNIYVPHRFQIS